MTPNFLERILVILEGVLLSCSLSTPNSLTKSPPPRSGGMGGVGGRPQKGTLREGGRFQRMVRGRGTKSPTKHNDLLHAGEVFSQRVGDTLGKGGGTKKRVGGGARGNCHGEKSIPFLMFFSTAPAPSPTFLRGSWWGGEEMCGFPPVPPFLRHMGIATGRRESHNGRWGLSIRESVAGSAQKKK
eukprot:Hpha_TRINITY_DN15230_c0_g1::TRINITY_DN15230_c0_g1_i1::g.68054::m.68054